MPNYDWSRDDTSMRYNLNTFTKQIAAIANAKRINAKRCSRDRPFVPVFSREMCDGGSRYFVVEDVSTFYTKYMDMKCRHRTFYEILQPNQSCHLYFDIEYDKLLNPNRDGEKAMAIFKRYLTEKVLTILGLHISDFVIEENGSFSGNIIEFDASNFKKFSKHIIVHLPGPYFFRDNIHVGQFVNFLCKEIKSTAEINNSDTSILTPLAQSLRQLFFKKKRGNIISLPTFIDQDVYSRYQNFRLVLSAKHKDIGKRHLNLYLSREKRALQQSLISQDIFNATLIGYPGLLKSSRNHIISWKPTEPQNAKLVPDIPSLCSNLSLNNKYNKRVNEVLSNGEKMFPKVVRYFRVDIAKSWPRHFAEAWPNLLEEKIPPSKDAYIYSIRYYNNSNPILTICVSGNRFCLNVKKRHTNNNILFVVDVANFCFTQKCHDDICGGYQSRKISLPPEIFFSTPKERLRN